MTAMPPRRPAVVQRDHAAFTFVASKTRQDVRFNVRCIKGPPARQGSHARAGMPTVNSTERPRTYPGVGPAGVPLHEQGHDLAPESGLLPLYAAPADYAVQLQDTKTDSMQLLTPPAQHVAIPMSIAGQAPCRRDWAMVPNDMQVCKGCLQ